MQSLQHHRKHVGPVQRKKKTVVIKLNRDVKWSFFWHMRTKWARYASWDISLKRLRGPFVRGHGSLQEHRTHSFSPQRFCLELSNTYIKKPHTHTLKHICNHTLSHVYTHLVTLKLGQCEAAKALLRWEEREKRWRWRVKVGRFRGQIRLCSHITALHSRGYGAWLHTAAAIMFVQALCHASHLQEVT